MGNKKITINHLKFAYIILQLTATLIIFLCLTSCGALSIEQPERTNPNDPNNPAAETITFTAPDELNAEAGFRTIALSWNDNSEEIETGFILERKISDETGWIVIAETAADISTYRDSDLDIEVSYRYRVKAVNESEETAYSNEITAVTWPLWESLIIDDASDESEYWETAITTSSNGDIFINYKNGSELRCARLPHDPDELQPPEIYIIDSAFGQYTDIIAFGNENVVTVFGTEKSNAEEAWYELTSAEFNGTSWVNTATVEAGGYDSINGADNTGLFCVLERNTSETYVSVYYYNDVYYNSERSILFNSNSQTAPATWATPDINNVYTTGYNASFIAAASYGSETMTYRHYSYSLFWATSYDNGPVNVMGTPRGGVAATATSDGVFHYIFGLNYNFMSLRYWYGSGEGEPGTTYNESNDCGYYPAITATPDDTLCSVFRDETNDTLIYRYKAKDDIWFAENAGGDLGYNGTFPDITTDANGLPVISFYDIDSGKVSVLRRRE